MSKLDKIVGTYISRNVGNRVPVVEDVAKAYKDGVLYAKKSAWNTEGTPKSNKAVVGLFVSPDGEVALKMIDPADFENVLAGDMFAWAYVKNLVPLKSVLDDFKKR